MAIYPALGRTMGLGGGDGFGDGCGAAVEVEAASGDGADDEYLEALGAGVEMYVGVGGVEEVA